MMGLSSGLAFGSVAGALHYASQSVHTHGSIRHLLQSMDLVDAQAGAEPVPGIHMRTRVASCM